MKQFLTLILAAMLACFPATAQQASLQGHIADPQGQGLDAVSIMLLRPDSSELVKADLSAASGDFLMQDLKPGVYVLRMMLSGYAVHMSPLRLDSGLNQLPPTRLQPLSTTLEGATVRASRPFVEVQADKLVVNVANSIVSAGSSALEVLARAPGVTVDQNDNISLKGRPGVTILIDGKPAPVQGTDLAILLRAMPAGSIDRIELIANPGARYDAAGNAGIINIRTRREKRMGINGSLNASYGQGIYPKYTSGMNLNYRNKKLSVFASYNYSLRYWFNHLMLDRRFYASGSENQQLLFAFDQDNNSFFNIENHTATLGADYAVSERTSLGLSMSRGSTGFTPEVNNYSSALDAGRQPLYYFQTIGNHNNNWDNVSGTASLRHNIDTNGRELSVDADYARYWNHNNQNFTTRYFRPDGSEDPAQRPYILHSDLRGLTQIRSIKADYTHPLRSGARLEAGLKASYVTADNEPLFYDRSGGGNRLDTSMSNHFIYSEHIQAAYVTASREWTRWSTRLGLRAEQTIAEGRQMVTGEAFDRQYIQLFPSMALQYHLRPSHDLGLQLSRRIERPNYQQLNPFKFFIDKTTYRAGYPYLSPALSWSAEVSHTFKHRFQTSFTYSITRDVLTEVIQPETDTVTVQTTKNLDRMVYMGLSGAYPFSITKWWTNVTNFNGYYARYEGFLAGTSLRNGRPTFNLHTNNSFTLPGDWTAELGVFYQARQIYGFMDLQPMWMLNAGVQKSLLNRKLVLRLNATDLFWKGYPRATSTFSNYVEDFVAQRETRAVTFSASWRFGRQGSEGPARRRSSGAEDEKRRAGNGGAG